MVSQVTNILLAPATSIHKMSNLTENMKQFFSDMLTDIETTSYYSQQQVCMCIAN